MLWPMRCSIMKRSRKATHTHSASHSETESDVDEPLELGQFPPPTAVHDPDPDVDLKSQTSCDSESESYSDVLSDDCAEDNEKSASKTQKHFQTRKISDYFRKQGHILQSNEELSETQEPSQEPSNSACHSSTDSSPSQVSDEDLEKISTGIIWSFFVRDTGGKLASCKLTGCSKSYATPDSTTSPLIRHLKTHTEAYSEYLRLSKLKDSIAKDKNKKEKKGTQQTLPAFLKSVAMLDRKSKSARSITQAIALFMCKGLHPYSIVEEKGFRNLLEMLEPRYKVPSRTTFSRKIIPNLYKTVKEKILAQLKKEAPFLESVSMTTDLWTSRAGDPFIAFTLQYMTRDFMLKHFTIDCQPFPERHTASAICEKVEDVIRTLSLDDDCISKFIVSDGGANVVCALSDPSEKQMVDPNVPEILKEKRNWSHLRCINHLMKLVVSDVRQDMGAIPVLDKVSDFVARYNRSQPARRQLKEFQKKFNLPQHEMIQKVVTRWDSEFKMAQRFLEQRPAISAEHDKANKCSLTVSEWKLLEGYVEILGFIARYTDDLGSAAKPTLSMVLPVLFCIEKDLEEFIKTKAKGSGITFARRVLANFRLRFPRGSFFENITYKIATLMDPRHKHVVYDPNDPVTSNLTVMELVEATKYKLHAHIKRGFIQDKRKDNQENLCTSAVKHSGVAKWGQLQKLTAKRAKTSNGSNSDDYDETIKAEVIAYLNSPSIDVIEDPCKWWAINRTMYPLLAPVAQHYLGICATEVSSERVFSVGGGVVTPTRYTVLDEHVRELVFLHDNL